MLWRPEQTEQVRFTVGSYGTDTVLDLKPAARDFRFVFFDFAGTKNEGADKILRTRAPTLLAELEAFPFTDPGVANWPLATKLVEIRRMLASVPDDREAAARYAQWERELATQLEQVRTAAGGAILAEAAAAKTIVAWERGLPALKLQALLNEI